MAGEKDLQILIANMEPVLNPGEYVFASVLSTETIPRALTICEVKEQEGTTVVLAKKDADQLDIAYEFVAAWITLNVHSALEAVGLTAAFSNALANSGISCNVIAGFYHDHIFVDVADSEKAMEVLQGMTSNSGGL